MTLYLLRSKLTVSEGAVVLFAGYINAHDPAIGGTASVLKYPTSCIESFSLALSSVFNTQSIASWPILA